MLNLPVPDTGTFFRTRDHGFLIPITRYGVTVRITKRKRITADQCGHVLTPIAKDVFYNGKALTPRLLSNTPSEALQRLTHGRRALDFRINPGLQLGVTKQDASHAIARCIRDGYVNTDGKVFNAGYLPTTSHLFPDGVPVFFDPDAFYLLWKRIRSVHSLIVGRERIDTNTYNANLIQNNLFQNLRTHYERVSKGTVDASTFWHACQNAVQSKLLVAGWKNSTEERDIEKNINGIANAYDAILPEL